ncbi:MAG TPA: electron transfer flavoprotein subunit alpha/FixB family protein [Candidatus Eisenbacteria bacterium]|nr:electron transfer flavoprotein subunit alpha/FixB family protein [Candidatus Eisenbacteria bacterium]
MSAPVLVFVEQLGSEADRLSLEAIAFARRIESVTGAPVEAVLIGTDSASVGAALGTYGVTTAHVADDQRLDGYAPAAWAAAIESLATMRSAIAVVAPGSDRGNEVLAHVAARLRLPMAANVVDVDPGEPWRIVRQRWAGSLLEDAVLDAPVRLMSVAPHVVAAEAVAPSAPASVAAFKPDVNEADLRVRVVSREAAASAGVSLTEARVVVGGGRGVGSAEGFGQLEELAGLLGGAVGGSRVVTSLGWRPHADQIGQTGLRIAPDLYIACGISGAIQHIVGCKAAKRILAINTDAESPIMAVADYAVIGDLKTIVPAITAEIRRRGETAANP